MYKRQAYYSWDTSKEAIEARTTEISKYLTKELQDLNADTIRTDIPTSATVTNVLVWNVKQSGTDDFTVAYEVDQPVSYTHLSAYRYLKMSHRIHSYKGSCCTA